MNTFSNVPDQGPYLESRDYALKNKDWTREQDQVGKNTMLALINRGDDVTKKAALVTIADAVNTDAEVRNRAAIAAGNVPASGDTFKRSPHAVACKGAKWLQELCLSGRIAEAVKDDTIAGLQLQIIQLQGQLTTANDENAELQGQVATLAGLQLQIIQLQEQLTTAHGENDELAKALSASEEAKRDMEAALKKSQAATEQTAACLKKRKRENDNNVDISEE
jgi:hypothetical protein